VAKKDKKASKKASSTSKAKWHLSPKDIKSFKQILLTKRKEIIGDMNEMEDESLNDNSGDLSSMPIHMADLGTDNYEQEFALELVDTERKLLRKIDDALNRIDEGTYGICEATDKPIKKARLEAKPWARYCIEYVREAEKHPENMQ